MLPAPARLRRGVEIREVVRSGRRSATPTLVVHSVVPSTPGGRSAPTQIGFLVSTAVGGAVVRNRVARQLRHLCAQRLALLPRGACLVVRALPAAAGQTSSTLAHDLDTALARHVVNPPVGVP